MAVKINVATTTPGGIDLPIGVIVTVRTELPAVIFQVSQTYSFYKDSNTVKNGGKEIPEIEGLSKRMTWDVTSGDYNKLTPYKLDQTALAYIESVVGVGNCSILAKEDLQPGPK